MLADYFTKPLQGSLFHKMRNVIMGYESIDTLLRDNDVGIKERVEASNSNVVIPNNNHSTQIVSGEIEKCKQTVKSAPSTSPCKTPKTYADIVKGTNHTHSSEPLKSLPQPQSQKRVRFNISNDKQTIVD